MAKKKIGVIVSGAFGRMGREVVKAVTAEGDMAVVGAFDLAGAGTDAGAAAGIAPLGVAITSDIKQLLKSTGADVMVDFAVADGFYARAKAALDAGVRVVVGTTGIPKTELDKVAKLSAAKKTGVFIAPNFAIGAVLMMKFAAMAAVYMPAAEIIELHHDKKLDAPSGTALYTAELMMRAKEKLPKHIDPTKVTKLPGARGGAYGDIAVHSVRLPGFIANQEVIFGGPGQILTVRHDTTSREAFMPGVVLAVRKSLKLNKLVSGLENLM